MFLSQINIFFFFNSRSLYYYLPWGDRDIRLYFNQHYTYAPGAFSCTQHCRHVHSHWSGVINLLKFDRIAKKKKIFLSLE